MHHLWGILLEKLEYVFKIYNFFIVIKVHRLRFYSFFSRDSKLIFFFEKPVILNWTGMIV